MIRQTVTSGCSVLAPYDRYAQSPWLWRAVASDLRVALGSPVGSFAVVGKGSAAVCLRFTVKLCANCRLSSPCLWSIQCVVGSNHNRCVHFFPHQTHPNTQDSESKRHTHTKALDKKQQKRNFHCCYHTCTEYSYFLPLIDFICLLTT